MIPSTEKYSDSSDSRKTFTILIFFTHSVDSFGFVPPLTLSVVVVDFIGTKKSN